MDTIAATESGLPGFCAIRLRRLDGKALDFLIDAPLADYLSDKLAIVAIRIAHSPDGVPELRQVPETSKTIGREKADMPQPADPRKGRSFKDARGLE